MNTAPLPGNAISAATPAQHASTLPARADVAVIGGGIVGVSAAWFLAKRGLKVALCEKGRIAGEQSSRNWGWVRAQGRDPAELPIMLESARIWAGLGKETGEDLGFRQSGVLYIAQSERELARLEAWLTHARAHRLDTQVLSPRALADLLPDAAPAWRGGLWTPSDARAEPWVAVPALARAAAREGVAIRENCAVRALDIAAGRVAGVVTEAGRMAADAVLLAGGAWSSLLARRHGLGLPQLSVRASVAATETLPEVFAGAAASEEFAFRRRLDGGYTIAASEWHEFFIGPDAFRHFGAFLSQILSDPFATRYLPAAPAGYPDGWTTPRRWPQDAVSPFERMRVLDPQPNRSWLEHARGRFAKAFPGLGAVRLKAAWAGMIDTMPDQLPVLDAAPGLPGLFIATGLSGHGFGIGPGVGRVMADLVRGGLPGHDLGPFRLSRFDERPRPRPGPAV